MAAVSGLANDSGFFAVDDVEVRLRPYQYYQLGDGKNNFVHIHCYIVQERTTEQKALLSRQIIKKLLVMSPDVSFLTLTQNTEEIFWGTGKDLESFQNSKFKNAFTINWWANSRINISEMIPQIDAIIQENKWERNNFISWKAKEENHQDHDVFISFDKVTKIIRVFNFRTDL